MGTAGPTPSDRLDYVYREYVRLSELADAYARSSFDDFRLLGAVGFVLAWPPISSRVFMGKSPGAPLLIGFVAIACVVTILAIRDLLKQSIVLFFHGQAGALEAELRDALGRPETSGFRLAEQWPAWDRRHYQPILLHFYCLFAALLLVFPNVALVALSDDANTAIYTPIMLVLTGIAWSATRRMPAGLAGPVTRPR